MNKKPGTSKDAADKLVKSIRRKTRQTYSAEEKIRIVLAGLRGEESISALCRREGISDSLYYSWSKEFLEAGKRRLSGDTARQATSHEVCLTSAPMGQIAAFAKRVFVAHRSHQGVDDEKDNEKPRREDRQRH